MRSKQKHKNYGCLLWLLIIAIVALAASCSRQHYVHSDCPRGYVKCMDGHCHKAVKIRPETNLSK